MSEIDDAELVRRYQQGDARAFAEFAARHRDRVYRVARHWLRHPGDAEDVVQEVFMRSLGGLTGFLFRAQPTTWLLRVTRNVCRETNRKVRRHLDVDDPAIQDALGSDGQAGADDHAQLRRHVRALPARQRDVVILRIFEELSVADTARALGCREGTVKAHLHKAIENLRQRMEQPT